MALRSSQNQVQWSRRRAWVAAALGIAGALFIWIVRPYNNFFLGLAYISSDSFLPVAALFLLMLVLAMNVVLHRWAPRLALSHRQLALILGVMLVASVLPGQGLLRMLPYSIAHTNMEINSDRRLAQAYESIEAPGTLFPDEVGYDRPARASSALQRRLMPDEPIPWRAWMGPLASWGGLLCAAFAMMVGLGMIVLPQWRHNERLAFPLIALQQSLIGTPAPGDGPPIYRRRAFWYAAASVFALHLLSGLARYFPGRVPAIALRWDLSPLFSEEPWLHLPDWITGGQVSFILLAVAFFMPSRIGFSLWSFEPGYALCAMIAAAYLPSSFVPVTEHRSGAMFAMTAVILWLGRRQWGRVFKVMLRRPADDDDRYLQVAGIMFFGGCLGAFGWFVWVGVQPAIAACYVTMGFTTCLLAARMAAETGVPFLQIHGYATSLIRLVPVSWLSAGSVFFGGVIDLVFQRASRVSAAVMAMHALGMDEKTTPRQRIRIAWLLLAVLIIGGVVCGAVHLTMSYHHEVGARGQSPLISWGSRQFDSAQHVLLEWQQGQFRQTSYNRLGHIAFGAVLAGALYWACLTWPRWPIHPIGLLMVYSFQSMMGWASVMLGWLLKLLVLRYGGAAVYRSAAALFVGMIVGEVLAAAFWSIVPAVLYARGIELVVNPVLIPG